MKLLLLIAALIASVSVSAQDGLVVKPAKPVEPIITTPANSSQSTNKPTNTRKSSSYSSTKTASSSSSSSAKTTLPSSSSSTNAASSSSSSSTKTTSPSSSTNTIATSSSGSLDSKEPLPNPKPTTGYINGHEYVDLGLSVKWATCNIGASLPSDYGNYYAWGETATKSRYIGRSTTYNKVKGNIEGDPIYDAARANWGGSWRLPTKAEIYELVSMCQWTWIIVDGNNGVMVTGPNGNSIFLPAAGLRTGSSPNYNGTEGFYWSSIPDLDDKNSAGNLQFGRSLHNASWCRRSLGCSIRPVSK